MKNGNVQEAMFFCDNEPIKDIMKIPHQAECEYVNSLILLITAVNEVRVENGSTREQIFFLMTSLSPDSTSIWISDIWSYLGRRMVLIQGFPGDRNRNLQAGLLPFCSPVILARISFIAP